MLLEQYFQYLRFRARTDDSYNSGHGLFGFHPHGVIVDALGDYEVRGRMDRISLCASKTESQRNRKFYPFLLSYQSMVDKEQEHLMFLLL